MESGTYEKPSLVCVIIDASSDCVVNKKSKSIIDKTIEYFLDRSKKQTIEYSLILYGGHHSVAQNSSAVVLESDWTRDIGLIKNRVDNFFSSRDMSRVLPSGLLNQRALTEALCSATHMFLGYSDKLDMFDKKIFVLTNSISHEAECKSCFNFDNCYDHAQRIGQMNIMLSIVAIELSMQSKDLWTCARTLEPCDTETSDKDVLFLLRNLPLAIYESQQTKKMPPKPTRPRQPPVKPATQTILHDNPRTIPNNYQPVSYQSSMVMPQKIYSRDLPTHTHYGSYNPHMKVQPMISSFPTIETLSVNLTMPPIGIISCDFIVTVNSVEDQEEIRHLQLIKNLTGFDEVTLNELQTIIELGYIKIKINAKESGETLEYALQSLFMSKKCLRVKLPRHTLYIRYNDGIEGCFVKNMLPQPSLQNNSSVQNFNRRSMSPVPKLINHGNQVEYHMNQGVPMRTSPSMDRRMPYRQENIGMITGPNFQSRGSVNPLRQTQVIPNSRMHQPIMDPNAEWKPT